MSHIHKTDDYNFAQPSRTGRAGFESFQNEADGRFYFHFNDAKGVPFLFSQAYQREMTRDKGIQSVIKNAAFEAQFERQDTEGGFYFSLKAGNKQEIARSRVFKSLVELMQKQTYLRQNLSLIAHQEPSKTVTVVADKPKVVEETAKPASGVSNALLKAENDDLKEKIAALEKQISSLQKVFLEEKDLSDDTLRHVFRIEMYKNNTPERLNGMIFHPFSEQKQPFSGFDSAAILSFMTNKMQADLPEITPNLKTPTPQYVKSETTTKQTTTTSAAKFNPSAERSPVKVVNLGNDTTTIHQNHPFALIINALPNERYGVQVGQVCNVEVTAFNLDTRERFKLMEKRTTVQLDRNKYDLCARIEPLVLNTGAYRLSLVVNMLSNNDNNVKWQGSIILQVF